MNTGPGVDFGEGVKTYLVGGAVRDPLLRREVTERDWVVVGATPDEMLARGFRAVGRDFPVFLHPVTREEYALARTERRVGPGHADFVCHADPGVTLEEDLARRDLTINAMARDEQGALVDPWNGQRDIAARVLRHVSPAFAEDPLRVFRVARFAAQLDAFGIADETLTLMKSMVGELSALSGERVWRELELAAGSPRRARFFETLRDIGERHWFGPLDLPATIQLFAARTFDTPRTALVALGWVNGAASLDRVCRMLRVPRLVHRASVSLARHGRTLDATGTPSGQLLDALTGIEAFRQSELTANVLDAVESCAGVSMAPNRRLIRELRRMRVDVEPGPNYGEALRRRRIAYIESRHT